MRRDEPGERSDPTVAVGDAIPPAPTLLVFHEGGMARHPLPDRGRIVIGRSRECEVRIDHPSISRRHAVLTIGPSLELEDLGSFNGTKVGGAPLPPNVSTHITPAGVIELGTVAISLKLVPSSTERAAAPAPAALPVSGAMDAVRRLVELVAASSISVILLGETGVGKTVVASSIHAGSPRASGSFVSINCAALPESLLESELLGHERGAFTGATSAKPGLIEAADKGTLFLDEIGELPLATQAKLLHVLESGEVLRIGSLKPRSIDVRFVAATNRDLEAAVAAGSFRRDLYFRLNGISIAIPPLRERRSEIAGLAAGILERAAQKSHGQAPSLSPEALLELERHTWPGNVRELRNVLERALILSRGKRVEVDHLQLSTLPVQHPAQDLAIAGVAPAPPEEGAAAGDLRGDLAAMERQRIVDALERCHGNQTQAAELLGISRRTLVNRLGTYDLPRPRRDLRSPKTR